MAIIFFPKHENTMQFKTAFFLFLHFNIPTINHDHNCFIMTMDTKDQIFMAWS